jgi:hypothetical protein
MTFRHACSGITRWIRRVTLTAVGPSSPVRDDRDRRLQDWQDWLDDRAHLFDAMRLDSAEDRELLAEILADAGAEVNRQRSAPRREML